MSREQQIEEMAEDLRSCHTEFNDGGDIYTDYDETARRMIAKGYHKQKLAQEVAADVLMEFIFVQTMEDVDKVYKNVFKRYGLCYDPFTNTPCPPAEYDECKEEWNRQMMENKYGYSEW